MSRIAPLGVYRARAIYSWTGGMANAAGCTCGTR